VGDPNLSNRKFPDEMKEAFVAAEEKALVELADALVQGSQENSGM